MGGSITSALDNTSNYLGYANQAKSYGYTPNQAEYNGMMADGTYDSTMMGMGSNQANSMFDMPGMEWAKMGIGGINSIMGALGTFDTMKTNKIARVGMEQNQQHAKMARADRDAFLGGTKSAFA